MAAAKTVSILGCGWLGLPLSEELVRRGYHVKGSTTTPEKLARLREVGVEPYLIRLEPELTAEHASDFFETDVLFFNVPPGRRRPDVELFFGEMIRSLQTELHYAPVDFVVFASSTSVYDDLNCTVIESDAGKSRPWSRSGRALLDAEALLLADSRFDTTVVRFGGLYGYDRQPGRFLAGRKDLSNGGAPVNLIHRDDAVAIVLQLIEQDVRNEVFNACADEHPTRRELYRNAARRLGLEPPTFADTQATSFKIVSNEKLRKRLGYQFRHPDPLQPAP